MKRHWAALLESGIALALVAAMLGCGGGGGGNGGGGGDSNVTGTWLMTSRTVNGADDTSAQFDGVQFSGTNMMSLHAEYRWPGLEGDKATYTAAGGTVNMHVSHQGEDTSGNGLIDTAEWIANPRTDTATYSVSGGTLTVDQTGGGDTYHMVFERVAGNTPVGVWRVASHTTNGTAVPRVGLMRIQGNNTFGRTDKDAGSSMSGATGLLVFGSGGALTVQVRKSADDTNANGMVDSGEWQNVTMDIPMTYTMPDSNHINLTWTEGTDAQTEVLERLL